MTASEQAGHPLDRFAGLLDGKTAVVTGAGRGIGASCGRALARSGAHVELLSRTANEIEEVVETIRLEGGVANATPLDVLDDNAVASFFASLDRVDVLINNAGTNRPQPFLEVDDESLDLMIALNIRAAFKVAQAGAQRMSEAGGVIVNMSSQMGHVGAAKRSVYCTTKHAIEGLTKAMAVELGPLGIRVNAVAPTFVRTSMTESFLQDPKFRRSVIRQLPMGRLAELDDVAAAVVYLASPLSASTTGTSLLVDCGWTAQ